MTKRFSSKFLTAVIFCLLCGIGQIFAQAGTGSIAGVTKDTNNAIVPNATVTLVSDATGAERSAHA